MRGVLKKIQKHERQLITAGVMILVVAMPYANYLVAQHQKKTTTHAATSCTVSPILVNSCRPWLGTRSTAHREVASDLKTQLLYHEQLISRQVDVVHDYARPGDTLSSFDIYAATRANTYLFLNYKPAGNWPDAGGGNASVNANIDKMANSIKSNVGNKKMFITIWHEPENDTGADSNCPGVNFKGPAANTPAAYKAMWQNVRNRFAADGVTNIVWAVDYMNYQPWACLVPDLYPGDNLVDWIVFNGYSNNGGSINWDSIISRFYSGILTQQSNSAHNFLSKPWGISEWGIDGNTQANAYAFYDNVKAALDANTFPKLKMYMIFDSIANDGTPGGHHIEEGTAQTFDQTEVNHYKAFANDPLISGASAPVTGTGGGGGGTPPPSPPPTPAPVPPAQPTVTASKMTVTLGSSVLLSWTSAGASSCVLNPGNVTSSGSTGSKLVTNIRQTMTYTVTCSNSAGSASSSVKITVSSSLVPAAPIIGLFSADPANVTAGAQVILRWNTSNVAANGCALVPSPLTSTAGDDSWQSPPLIASVSYTLTCKNSAGQTVSKSVGVTVNNAPAPAAPPASPPSAAPASGMTVHAANGQTVVNAQANDTASEGQLVTLDPSNILDQKKSKNILRVEYYNGDKLIQTVVAPPYALNSKVLRPGTYTVTERTYYKDGSSSERTQDITVQSAAVVKPGSHKGALLIIGGTAGLLAVVAGAWVIGRKLLGHQTEQAQVNDIDLRQEFIITPQQGQPQTGEAPAGTEQNRPSPPANLPGNR